MTSQHRVFTDRIKAIQERKGSRDEMAAAYDEGNRWGIPLTPDAIAFIQAQDSCYLGTSNAQGQPYIQHRGGPPGFLQVTGPRKIAFADFRGNKQYITQGNLEENPKATLFLIDYANRQRIKLWGEAQVFEGNDALIAGLMPPGYRAKADQVIEFKVALWDINCPQHIPQKLNARDVKRALDERDARIAELEALLAANAQ